MTLLVDRCAHVMLVRTLAETKAVEWGNGLSRRLLLADDRVGFTVTDTLVRAGSSSRLRYSHHVEACYCVAGCGWVTDDSQRHTRLRPGTLYALDQHELHTLIADAGEDLRLVCVFTPPLQGDEAHDLRGDGYSSYGPATAGSSPMGLSGVSRPERR